MTAPGLNIAKLNQFAESVSSEAILSALMIETTIAHCRNFPRDRFCKHRRCGRTHSTAKQAPYTLQ
jgi:hypothetical protein